MVPLPLSPVPVTTQTLLTYLAALLLGGRLVALSQLFHVLPDLRRHERRIRGPKPDHSHSNSRALGG
ncbi:hypothetical protein [Infirmifilum sp. NZ]|uniref:hypothetical protein n=1 Tax=Infirmifilum sp. NZ TaxID=2926850 RepID=UPI002798921A|nr:hypothetical protein [Infirmifilum sp. NZ]UNQ73482.1 hypothetical protein MOV14_00365 [Infirmifilum sp. NZ]